MCKHGLSVGHKNIVFIGQDLAFGKDGASHAKGHTIAQPDENLYITAYGGEGEVRTTYVWTLFKNQFENDIEQSKLENITSYNCTEGGARIEGTIERPFLEVMRELCVDKKEKKLPHISKNSEKTTNNDMLKAYKVIQEKIKMQGQSHAATLRLPGKSATCKSSPTPPKAVSSGLLLAKNKCETDFFE